jgi:hypothetical protein
MLPQHRLLGCFTKNKTDTTAAPFVICNELESVGDRRVVLGRNAARRHR